jgi:tRNA/rRNA methyltransferase
MTDNAPAIILVRPQLGENIGMAARAMRNFALADLRIVAPRDGWGSGHPVMEAAVAAAAGAGDILKRAPVFPCIRQAAAGLSRLYATTARDRGQDKPVLTPAEAMPQITDLAAKGARCGILFGAERTGLTNEEVSLADAVVSFPVDPDFASLNLAQAVLLMAYDWRRMAASAAPKPEESRRAAPASRDAVLALFDDLEKRLADGGYFREPKKRGLMMINLRNILHRIGLENQDVRTLRGVIRALGRSATKRPGAHDPLDGGTQEDESFESHARDASPAISAPSRDESGA